jgi:hypothetical protein
MGWPERPGISFARFGPRFYYLTVGSRFLKIWTSHLLPRHTYLPQRNILQSLASSMRGEVRAFLLVLIGGHGYDFALICFLLPDLTCRI